MVFPSMATLAAEAELRNDVTSLFIDLSTGVTTGQLCSAGRDCLPRSTEHHALISVEQTE